MSRHIHSTTILLTIGFAISIMSILIGISTINTILTSVSNVGQDIPILATMQNTGLSLAFSVYLFSLANCLVVVNYQIITKRRDIAICKAFGWSNRNIIFSIMGEISAVLLVSLGIGSILIVLLSRLTEGIISVKITPFFLCGTTLLLLATLSVSMIIPLTHILKIRPAEVIS